MPYTGRLGEARVYPRAVWRLLKHGPANGALNMALDEAILMAVAEGEAPPTLRFYTWQPPCLSVGYGQPLSRYVNPKACAAMGYDLVRRPTGGRAILHIDELTYSVVLPQDDPRVSGGVAPSFQRLGEALLVGLRRLGMEPNQVADRSGGSGPAGHTAACFDLPSHFEITVGGRKLVGSAQLRRRGVVLQHGALPLWGDTTRIVRVLHLSSAEHGAALKARLAKTATTVTQAAGRVVTPTEVKEALAAGFAEALNLELAEGELTAWEYEQADRLRREKYEAEEYTSQR